MKFEPIEQRSDDWYKKRLGKPTASQFGRIIMPSAQLKLSTQAALYKAELIAERIFGRQMGKDISNLPAVRHGVETEAEARRALEERIGPIQDGGFMTDDRERYGASPDGILVSGNRREVIELKCPYEIPRHIKNLLYGPDDSYRAQIQGQLLISGFNAAHFFSYHPNCPPYYERIERDEPYLRVLDTLLDKFCEELESDYQRALAAGAWGV